MKESGGQYDDTYGESFNLEPESVTLLRHRFRLTLDFANIC